MPFVHGKGSAVSLGGADLSIYSSEVEWSRAADSHDVTTFGKNSHVRQGGLLDGTAKITGIYDSTAVNGPRAVINPKLGTVVVLVWRPEGVGAGKPQDLVNVLVKSYTETSPVADMIKFAVDLELSDDVLSGPQ